MGAFLGEFVSDLRSAVPWVLWLTIAMAVAIAGPFGSYGTLTLSERVLFWTPIIGLSVVVGTAVRALVHGTLAQRGTLKGSLLALVLNCLLLCPPLFVLFRTVFPPIFSARHSAVEIFLLVASLSLGICALRVSAKVPEAAPVAGPDPALPVPEPRAEPRLARRLDADRRGEIWAISVRDHYVDVLTSTGATSLLMRLSDAMAEVDGVAGAQVHRSHWVAWAGVARLDRVAGKMTLHLKTGQQIPVSRNNRDKVEAAVADLVSIKAAAA